MSGKRVNKTSISFPPKMLEDLELLEGFTGRARSEIIRDLVGRAIQDEIQYHLLKSKWLRNRLAEGEEPDEPA